MTSQGQEAITALVQKFFIYTGGSSLNLMIDVNVKCAVWKV